MSNPTFFKNFTAAGALAAFRFCRLSAADRVVQSAGVNDVTIGVNLDFAVVSGERVDLAMGGIVNVEAGAAFAVGSRLTSDAMGRAVAAAPAAGANNHCAGIAMEAAVAAGDIVRVLFAPQSLQG